MTPFQPPVSSAPLFQDPPFVAALLVLAAALGRRVLCLLGAPRQDLTRLELGLISAALGLGLLQYLPFTLGMAHALTPKALWLALLLLGLLLAFDVARVVRALGHELATLRHARPPLWMGLGLGVMGVALSVALLGALSPPTDTDGLYYQLTAPKRWLQQQDLGYLPTLLQSNLMMGLNMLFTLALAVWSDTAAKLIHFACGVASVFAVFALGRRLKSAEVGFSAALLFLFALQAVPSLDVLRLFSWAYVDLGITFEMLAAVLAWLFWSRTGARGWLVASALCAGFATSFKLTGAMTGAALAGMVLATHTRNHEPWRRTLFDVVQFGVIALLPALPWFVRSFVLTGSPVYPVLAKLLPTRDWPAEAAAAFDGYFKYYVWGTGYSSAGWSLGVRKAVRALALLGTFGVTAVVVARAKEWETRALAFVAGCFTLFCVLSTGLYVRYVVPALPLAYLVLAIRLEGWLKRSSLAKALLLSLAAGNALLYLRATSVQRWALAASGARSRDAYLAEEIPVSELWRAVNRVVPADARILLAAGRPSYYMEPYCFVTEAYYQARLRMDTWEHYLSDVRRDRIEYAIVHDERAPIPNGPPYPAVENEQPFARRLVDQFGQELHASGTDRLYRLSNLTLTSNDNLTPPPPPRRAED